MQILEKFLCLYFDEFILRLRTFHMVMLRMFVLNLIFHFVLFRPGNPIAASYDPMNSRLFSAQTKIHFTCQN